MQVHIKCTLDPMW